jgi:putative Mg2+ transporter-C (MgtC) family protein
MWSHFGEDLQILGQACIALVLGGIIGFERERAGKSAGIRTHMLICISTTLFVRTGEILLAARMSGVPIEAINSDPVRILEAIVTGIAFIGAGTVFRDRARNAAYGLTTAASMLCVVPIGAAVAVNRFVLAAGITILAWLVLRVFGVLEQKFGLSKQPREAPGELDND